MRISLQREVREIEGGFQKKLLVGSNSLPKVWMTMGTNMRNSFQDKAIWITANSRLSRERVFNGYVKIYLEMAQWRGHPRLSMRWRNCFPGIEMIQCNFPDRGNHLKNISIELLWATLFLWYQRRSKETAEKIWQKMSILRWNAEGAGRTKLLLMKT